VLSDFKDKINKYRGITDVSISGQYQRIFYKNLYFSFGFVAFYPLKPDYSIISNDATQYIDKSPKINSCIGLYYLIR
jgi:hypothetical protein